MYVTSPSSPPKAASISSVQLESSATPRILIIDDEAAIRESLDTLLTLEGFDGHVSPAMVSSGLELPLTRTSTTLLLLDLALPGESPALDLLPRIR